MSDKNDNVEIVEPTVEPNKTEPSIEIGDTGHKPVKLKTIYFAKFTTLLGKGYKRAAIFTHAAPDPDAIGSMMGMRWILERQYQLEADCFFVGPISHPQNMAMVNLLDPELRLISEYVPASYDLTILVDAVPPNAGIAGAITSLIEFDLVIDHHKENYDKGLFINLKAGSCCATIYDIIDKLGLSFDGDNDADAKVATAMMLGISTDTENLMSDDSTEYEFKAWAKLFDYRNPGVLKQIVHFERPKFWIDSKAESIMKATIEEGVAVVGMGIIPSKHRDMIADMADEMVNWEAVHTAVVFSLVGGNRIEGSVRSNNASISVPQLCKDLGIKAKGVGGGKLGKGAYKYDLGGGGIDAEDDEETIIKTWELFNEKETKRIMRIIKK